ncbi:uncharacterized protein LOC103964201 isoform X1 [Pyrus x bretschneideri]|uniref:uncharacterized protein LOC103964201 isoform X1 n=1 Tax=Pyrus x bretschneideri TaxID=225117 RepID=UPI00202DF0F8|nr:uncharacterized protein LOC103964201 isoform X1 [Pyrus x bretschneideri]
MGRRGGGGGGGAKRVPNTAFTSTNNISLREELTGKKQTKGGSSINAKAVLKLEHLQRLAVWTGTEASVPSLGAFFGRTLAAAQEAIAVPPEPSLFPCQRCETVLQPGFNCTVRIEKNRAKARQRSKKLIHFSQNNVVYTCHFCSHRNLKKGTSNGHMKTICPPKAKTTSKLNLARSISKKFVNSKKATAGDEVSKVDEIAPSTGGEIPTVNIPAGEDDVSQANEVAPSAGTEIPSVDTLATPAVKTGITLLLGGKKRRRNNSATKKPTEPKSSPTSIAENTTSTSNKRRRKSWTSLKEIAKHSDCRIVSNELISK